MRNIIKTLLVVLMLNFSHSAIAGDLNDGIEAFEKGDFATALRLWTPLAGQGDADAQFLLGAMYFEGQGVAQDYKTAVKWYTLAAERGLAQAQSNLGVAYANGNGVAQNYKTAVKWYTLAAEQGIAIAQFNLGTFYDQGHGVAQDYKTAFKWYTLAAEQGDAPAQSNIGTMYANGQGVAQDYVNAHMWFNIAAIDGNSKNAASNRDKVTEKMTPAQIEKAQEAASRCIEQNFKNCDFSTISTNSTSMNDEIYQDALAAIKAFESSFKQTGMTGIVISTIPDCYKKIKKNSSYRAVRVCGMIDLWSASVEQDFSEMFKKQPNEELTIFKFIERLENAKRYLNDEDRTKLGEGKNWLKLLNEVSSLQNK